MKISDPRDRARRQSPACNRKIIYDPRDAAHKRRSQEASRTPPNGSRSPAVLRKKAQGDTAQCAQSKPRDGYYTPQIQRKLIRPDVNEMRPSVSSERLDMRLHEPRLDQMRLPKSVTFSDDVIVCD